MIELLLSDHSRRGFVDGIAIPLPTICVRPGPPTAIGFLLHAATLDTTRLGDRRALTMPAVSATVGDELDALRRVGGEDAARRVHHEPDAAIARIVAGWPRAFEARRARALGFTAEGDFDEIVRAYVEDELGA